VKDTASDIGSAVSNAMPGGGSNGGSSNS
jgi:hypothetical protein